MLKATNIRKSYMGIEVLCGIDIEVNKGEFISIMGESGSGKSTLLSILGSNALPDSGTVYLFGNDTSKLSDEELSKIRRTKLGFVYQSLNLINTLSLEDNILLPLYLDKQDLREGRKKLSEIAKRLKIENLLHKMPSEASGGQRQRVAIARTLIHSPELIFMDEPTGSLDSRTTAEVMELLRSINSSDGVSIIQVTHSLNAASYGSRIINLKDGRIFEE